VSYSVSYSQPTDGVRLQQSTSEGVLPHARGGRCYTEDGFPIRCRARVKLENGPGYIELGVEQPVQIELQCIEGVVVEPGVSFDLSEGARVVARATVLSVLERIIHPTA
jgi:hypothetical protein